MNKNTTNIKRHAYIVGGGIGGLATAFFLLRDGKMSGSDITIFEELELVGGSCDGKGTAKEGYLIRGGRMLNLPTYECLWAMLMDVPSLNDNEVSVYDEVVEFNRKWKIDVHARLIAKNQQIVNAKDMQFSVKDKLDLVKLMAVSEHSLGEKRISECFEASFFKTNFWYLWATTFAFQTWHSAVELRRYMYRFMHEFYRIYNLSGIHRTPYNQYDSFILPITKHLKKKGVHFKHNCAVTDLVIEEYLSEKKVTTIKCVDQKNEHSIKLEENDIVIATIGSMTENSSVGSNDLAPKFNIEKLGHSWQLWKNIAKNRPELGNPDKFICNIDQSFWESFTVTFTDDLILFNNICEFSGNLPGTGALMSLKDSSWLMSTVIAHQPHFINQPENIKVMWGYGLFPNNIGDHVKKPMRDCSGKEIIAEICYHYNCLDKLERIYKSTKCTPCLMPFITSEFMPRLLGDRPQVVPKGYSNLGLIGQYSEIEKDVVFTVEYSVRGAQIAVYTLLGLSLREIPEISEHQKEIKVVLESLEAMIRKG